MSNCRKAILTALVLLGAQRSWGQFNLEWAQTEYGGFNYYFDEEPALVMAFDGGVLVKSGKVGFTTGRDILLLKYNADGSLDWSFDWNGSANGFDRANGVKQGPDGSLYLFGTTQTTSFDRDALLIKLDAEGSLIWTQTLSGTNDGDDDLVDIAVAEDGGVYATGWVSTQQIFEYGRVVLARILATGEVDWQQLFAQENGYILVGGRAVREVSGNCRLVYAYLASGANRYRTVLVSPTGQVMSDGGSHCTEGAGAHSYALDPTGAAIMGGGGVCRYAVYKSSLSGIVLWANQEPTNMAPGSYGDECTRLVTDVQGYIYSTGRHYGDSTNCDILTWKVAPSGTIEWSYRYEHEGSNNCEVGEDVFVTSGDHVFVAGRSQQNGSGSTYDAVVLVLDQSGELIGDIRFDGGYERTDCAWSVVGDDAEVYVAGMSEDDLGVVNLFVRKYSIATDTEQQSSSSKEIHAVPNPMVDYSVIQIPRAAHSASELVVIDATGRIVHSEAIAGRQELRLDRGSLHEGVYIISLVSDNGREWYSKLAVTNK